MPNSGPRIEQSWQAEMTIYQQEIVDISGCDDRAMNQAQN
jgi:hypothetical protein